MVDDGCWSVWCWAGKDLSDWQAKRYSTWRQVETEKEHFDVQLKLEEWGEKTENMQLSDKRLSGAMFREEIFQPGSSAAHVARFGGVLPEREAERASMGRRPSTSSSGSNPFARRRKSEKPV